MSWQLSLKLRSRRSDSGVETLHCIPKLLLATESGRGGAGQKWSPHYLPRQHHRQQAPGLERWTVGKPLAGSSDAGGNRSPETT
eukprot:1238112-Prorocentrum_lima.AAC.1